MSKGNEIMPKLENLNQVMSSHSNGGNKEREKVEMIGNYILIWSGVDKHERANTITC